MLDAPILSYTYPIALSVLPRARQLRADLDNFDA